MGYCCPYAFFRLYKRTGLIAARLGVTERTVRRWKAKFRTKELSCAQAGLGVSKDTPALICMLQQIRRMGK